MVGAFSEVTHIGDQLPFWICVCWKAKPFSLADEIHFLVDEWLTYYLITKLFAIILLLVIVSFYHGPIISFVVLFRRHYYL